MIDATSPVPVLYSAPTSPCGGPVDKTPSSLSPSPQPAHAPRVPNGIPGGIAGGGPGRRPPIQCGDLPFLIRRDGTWLYRGSSIERKELVCLFASVLRRASDGSWWLRTPAEHGRIEVEDAPFVAVELCWNGDGQRQTLSFRTNTDQVVAAGPGHPIRVAHDDLTGEPTPYILLSNGDGALGIEARVNRAVYYELVALAVPEYIDDQLMLGVWSSDQFFPLGPMPLDEFDAAS